MRIIIEKEIKELWRDGRFKFSGIIVLILLCFASITGFNQYKRLNAEYKIAEETERAIWESQDAKNPHSAAHYGTYAFKPKFALSLFDNGVNQYTGNTIFLEAHRRNEAAYSEASDQTELLRFGKLSLNFVLLYLLPLVILLLGYNALSKEREMDTLRLLKSQGVGALRLIFGKWLSICLPVCAITVLLFLLLGIFLSALQSFAYFSWFSLLLLLVSYLIYYMVIISVVLLVSLFSKSSGMALVVNLSLWILFCFIAPKVSTNFANDWHQYPSKQQFYANIQTDREKGLDGHNPWNKEAKRLKAETLKAYGVDSVEQLPFNYDAYRMQKGEEHEARVFQKHYDILKDIFKAQNNTYQQMAVISPFIPIRLLSMEIANTSYIAHWNFSDAAEKYRIEAQKYLNNDFKDNSKTGDWNYKMTKEKFSKLPLFNYTPPTINEILWSNIPNFLILLVWLIVPLGLLIFYAKKL